MSKSSHAILNKARKDSREFVRSKFFMFTNEKLNDFVEFYAGRYGNSAATYLLNTYSMWSCGAISMSYQTEHRILECVPKFLSREDQFKILRFYLPWISTLKETDSTSLTLSEESLAQAYEDAYKHILEQKFELEWFTNEIFSSSELIDIIQTFKLLLLKRLEISYRSVCNDLNRLINLIQQADCPVSIGYHIYYLDRPLSINSLHYADPLRFNTSKFNINTEENNKEKLLGLFLNDAIKIENETVNANINSIISENDVKLVLEQIKLGSNQEIKSTVVARGEGGRITLHFMRKDLQRMRCELIKNGWIFGGVIILLSFIYLHGFYNDYIKTLIFPGGIVTFLILATLWGRFLNTKHQINEYERKRSAWFTKS
jgi:hypothetical protein